MYNQRFDVEKVKKILRLQKIRHVASIRKGDPDPIAAGEVTYLEGKIQRYLDYRAQRAALPFAKRYASAPTPLRKVNAR